MTIDTNYAILIPDQREFFDRIHKQQTRREGMKKLRILLVEDNLASIESCMEQFKSHEVVVAKTCMELLKGINAFYHYDLILSDMNIPMGEGKGFDVLKYNEKGSQWVAGMAVAMLAMQLGKPCCIVTDSSGHRDVFGLLIENISPYGIYGPRKEGEDIFNPSKPMVTIQTGPEWIDTKLGKGKDWLAEVRRSPWAELLKP